jgi:hypothetical protein
MKIYISDSGESYGISTPNQIEAVHRRMEIMAEALGIEAEYRNPDLRPPDDSHPLTEAIFEQAMDCAGTCPPELTDARTKADQICPLPMEYQFSISVIDSNGREWEGLSSNHQSREEAETAFDLAVKIAGMQELHTGQTVDITLIENDELGNGYPIESTTLEKE